MQDQLYITILIKKSGPKWWAFCTIVFLSIILNSKKLYELAKSIIPIEIQDTTKGELTNGN